MPKLSFTSMSNLKWYDIYKYFYPYEVFVDGEYKGSYKKSDDIQIEVDKSDFDLTIKYRFFTSTKHCSISNETARVEIIPKDRYFGLIIGLLWLAVLIFVILHTANTLPAKIVLGSALSLSIIDEIYIVLKRNDCYAIKIVQ